MTDDILSSDLIQSAARGLSVPDLIRTTETLKQAGQLGSVLVLYATWIQHNQEDPLLYAVLFNYSVILADLGKLDLARRYLERSVSDNPAFMPAHINLGRIYERLGDPARAVATWSVALTKMAAVNGPAITYKTTALNQSARALEAANQDAAAEELLRESLDLYSHQREATQHWIALRQRQGKWPVIVPSERVARSTLLEGMSPLSAAAYTDDPLLLLAMAWNYNQKDVGTPKTPLTSWPKAESASGPLRVGYLSSDLREHAVGYLMTEVFGLHDREQVEVFAYYSGPEARDPLHQHFRATADHFESITDLDDEAAAGRIAADGIQILVDLNGYTREARLKLVALRPAPVIVNWLGFPGSMASPYHHYIIADDSIIPESHELYYSEKVLRLPCYQPSHRTRAVAPSPPKRSDVGLPDRALVYCSFNGAHKLNRFTFDRWLTILSRVEGSVLWLLDSTASQNLRKYAESRGIAGERLVFAEKLSNPHHLARYPLADLFLDTNPYGAHTTASDALWMGVPVLTWSGRSFAARVCGSLVRAAGLPELVCDSASDFVERAVALGKHPGQLDDLRNKLRAARQACTLFDLPGLVQKLEGLYRSIWDEHRQGRLPRPNLANLERYLELGLQTDHEQLEMQSITDYHGHWREVLRRGHAVRPLYPDPRSSSLGALEPTRDGGAHVRQE